MRIEPLGTHGARRLESVVLLSPCGHGNLGDAAIQDAVISQVRKRFPDAEIVAATLNPRDTEQRHGIRGFPLAAFSRPGYDIHPAAADQEPQTQAQAFAGGGTSWGVSLAVNAAVRTARTLLPRGWPWAIRTAFGRLHAETRHIARVFRLLRGTRCLIVSGGGQLDEFWGGSWGHPYSLFKWALAARLRGVRVLFLSVGFGSLPTVTGRLFTRRALALASYRSYRDAGSRSLMRSAGFTGDDPVYPDLAYGTPSSTTPRESRDARGAMRIGVSPIIYCDPRTWPRKDLAVYQGYLRRLAEVTRWLLDEGHDVVLLTSDKPDLRAAHDLLGLLQASRRNGHRPVEIADTASVASFMQLAMRVDLVVASRLHGVLLSHVAGAPTIALSYERKVSALMSSLDQDYLCLDIETFQLDEFRTAFQRLRAEFDQVHRLLRTNVINLRRQLNEQYDVALAR